MADFDTQVATLLFLLYVRVVDIDKSIGLRDIEKFDRLMDAPEALNLPLLNKGLVQLRGSYSQWWTSYRKGQMGQTNDEITRTLDAIDFQARSESWLELRDALVKYVNYFAIDSSLASKLLSKQDIRKNRVDQVGLITLLIMNWKPRFVQGSLSQEIAALETSQLLMAVSQSVKNILFSFSRDNDSTGQAMGANQRLICVDVTHENANVATYKFATQNNRLWAFQPGQFLTFDIPNDDVWVRRSYSISSSPSQPYFLDVTIKKLPGGYGSNWFHDQMKVGKEVIARGPHGNFSFFNSKREKLFLMAAGVGITPIMSMLRWQVDTLAPYDTVVFNRVHSLEDAIFTDELATLEKRSKGRIRVVTMTTVLGEGWPSSLNVIDGSRGSSMSPDTLMSLASDLQERAVFICGPDTFIHDVKDSLGSLAFDFEHFYQESFIGLNNSRPDPNAVTTGQPFGATKLKTISADIPPELQCQVEFKRSAMTVTCQIGDNLLEVAELHGIDIPNSCRMGSCGSCKCIKLSGDIELMNSDGLSAADKASHHVLLCVGQTSSANIVIDA